MKTKAHHDWLRDQGEADCNAGKPIGAFYDLPLKRHTELERGSYETGWRAARGALRILESAERRAHNS